MPSCGDCGDRAAGRSGIRPSRSSAARPQMFPLFWWMCPDSHMPASAEDVVCVRCGERRQSEAQRGDSQNHWDIPAALVSVWRRARSSAGSARRISIRSGRISFGSTMFVSTETCTSPRPIRSPAQMFCISAAMSWQATWLKRPSTRCTRSAPQEICSEQHAQTARELGERETITAWEKSRSSLIASCITCTLPCLLRFESCSPSVLRCRQCTSSAELRFVLATAAAILSASLSLSSSSKKASLRQVGQARATSCAAPHAQYQETGTVTGKSTEAEGRGRAHRSALRAAPEAVCAGLAEQVPTTRGFAGGSDRFKAHAAGDVARRHGLGR